MPRVVPSQIVGLIDQLFPQYRVGSNDRNLWFNQTLERCYGLQAVLDLTDQIPPALLVLSNSEYAALVTSIASIRNVMKNPKQHGNGLSIELAPMAEFGNLNPISLLRDLLQKCPDEFPSPGTAELSFISDQALRDILRNDIGAINRALSDSEWKGATVLAGAILEALLLWALQQLDPSKVSDAANTLHANHTLSQIPPTDLEQWNLTQYIEVSRKLDVISGETASQARLAKNFRNLIHPGRSQRLRQVCNRATALSAVAGVEHVLQDLTP